MTDLTLEVAKEWFEYNPDTGVLIWRKRPSPKAAAFDVCPERVRVRGVRCFASRIAWLLTVAGTRYVKFFKVIEEAQEWVEFVRQEAHGVFANHGKFEVQNGY